MKNGLKSQKFLPNELIIVDKYFDYNFSSVIDLNSTMLSVFVVGGVDPHRQADDPDDP